MKAAAKKSYAKKGDAVVQKNYDAIDAGINAVVEIKYPESWATTTEGAVVVPVTDDPYFHEYIKPIQAQQGDSLPVSRMTPDGTVPTAGPLAFDHERLLTAAWQRIQSKVEYTSLPAFLLSEPFTLPQLQQAYELVLGRELDRSAFRRRALSMPGFLREAGVLRTGAPRAPMGYELIDRQQPMVFPRAFEPRTTRD